MVKQYFFFSSAMEDINSFKLLVDTDITGTGTTTGSGQFQYYSLGSYNVVATHEDGVTIDNFTQSGTGVKTLTLSKGGKWLIEFSNTITQFYFNNNYDRNKVKELRQWGTKQWTSISSMFYGCNNLIFTAIDYPDFSLLTDGLNAFRDLTSVVTPPDVSQWDLSSLTIGSYMFSNWSSCTSPMDTSNWTLTALTNGEGMFYNWTSCTSPMDLSSATFANLTIGTFMFYNWTSCTSPMDLSSATFANLTIGQDMFQKWTSCTSPMDLSSATFANLTSGQGMFQNWTSCTGTFNISGWSLNNLTIAVYMFYNSKFTLNIDWTSLLTGSINVDNISNILGLSNATSAKMQAGNITNTGNFNTFSTATLTELILIDLNVSLQIRSASSLTGTAIDDLADSVRDMTGSTSPSVTMTTAQKLSCDTSKWTSKNWTIIEY